jgi:antiphage defense system Thoeris ThsB-like protein
VRCGVPSRIGELFRDDKEMAAKPDLAGYIKQALWESEHLIVVCSSATPASDWVRAEIALFKHWGRVKRIHALLIEADAARAFPAELRYWRIAGQGPQAVMEMAEPAAASVAPGKSEAESKALARDKLAAALLGCDLDPLRDALARRERAQTTYGYFERIVWRRAVPEGVGEVSSGDVAYRNAALRFESRRGRIERISRINGSGSLRDNDERVAQWDITYRGDGSVETVELRNKLGRLVTRRSFNRDASHVDFSTEAETAHAQGPAASVLNIVANEDRFRAGKSEIVRHLLDYDDNGFVVRRRQNN